MSNTENALQFSMENLVNMFPECGIVLLVTPFFEPGEPPQEGRVVYISNAPREQVLLMMEEMIARFRADPSAVFNVRH